MQTPTHTEDVVIRQGGRRMTATATVAGDTTRPRREWTIVYQVADPEVVFDEARPLEVVFAGGGSGRFMPVRKVGRARLGVGVGHAVNPTG
jgi:hypothetical protein